MVNHDRGLPELLHQVLFVLTLEMEKLRLEMANSFDVTKF